MTDARIKKLEIIGRGTYGIVRKLPGICNEKKTTVAVKFFFSEQISSGFLNLREIDIHRYLQSEFISRTMAINTFSYKFYPRDASLEKRDFLALMTELADCDGSKYFEQRNYSTRTALILSSQLLAGIGHMHRRNICHRDIKPGNVLIFGADTDHPILKICDFGFSTYMASNSILSPNVNTPWYRAPESSWGLPDYKLESDIWCVGCTIYEIFTGDILMSHVKETENPGIYMEGCLKVIPTEWTIEDQVRYRGYKKNSEILVRGSKEIRKILPKHDSFMPRFRAKSKFQINDGNLWLAANEILKECFNYNYRHRIDAIDLLMSPHFDEIREYVNSTETIINKDRDRVGEIIEFSITETDNEEKVAFFTEALSVLSHKPFRIFFHAVDLANRYLTIYPGFADKDDLFSSCIYLFEKYFAIMTIPENPEVFFFRKFTQAEITDLVNQTITEEQEPNPDSTSIDFRIRHMDRFVYDFEKIIIDKEYFDGLKIYRVGPYEMQDDYIHELSEEQIRRLFLEFLKISNWCDFSYRYMYRELCKELFKITPISRH